jgi:hypothetical protein
MGHWSSVAVVETKRTAETLHRLVERGSAAPHLYGVVIEVDDEAVGIAKISARREFIQELLIQDGPEGIVRHGDSGTATGLKERRWRVNPPRRSLASMHEHAGRIGGGRA